MDKRILLINTGGTFDSVAYPNAYNPPEYVETLKGDDSLVMPVISGLPNHHVVDGFSWGLSEGRFVKDSKEFTPDDMAEIADIIRRDEHQYFVLTHGTDQMIANATLLQQLLADSGKTVVMMGAIVPLSMRDRYDCDGVRILSHTLEHIEELPEGVHIAAHNANTKRVGFFNPEAVEKDRTTSLQELRFSVNYR